MDFPEIKIRYLQYKPAEGIIKDKFPTINTVIRKM